MARRAILLFVFLVGALQACATKAPPRAAAPRKTGAAAGAPVKLAVLPSDSLLFADVASALDRQLAQARLGGVGPMVRAKVSMEVAQLALECVSPTDECYTQVGRFLQVDRLLWGSIARGPQAAGVHVTVVLLDVARGAPVARAEATFAESDAAIGGLRQLVDRATGVVAVDGAPAQDSAKSAMPKPPVSTTPATTLTPAATPAPARSAPVSQLERKP